MKLPGFLNRKKSDESAVPEDLQQYYGSGNSSVGKTILRVAIFVVVLALLVWAGIWLFNKLTNNDDKAVNNPTTATTQQSAEQKKAAEDKAKADAEAKKAADAKAKADAEAQKKAAEAKAAEKKATDEANKQIAEAQKQANGSPAPAPQAATPTPAPTPSPTATSGLPSTGPNSTELVEIFAGVSIVGAFFHSLYLRRRQHA